MTRAAQYIIAIILYIVTWFYSIVFAVSIGKRQRGANPLADELDALHHTCIISGTSPLADLRGNNYYIDEIQSCAGECAVTFWGASHFALYTLFGIFTPDLFWETFLAGIVFEYYEYRSFQCHDA